MEELKDVPGYEGRYSITKDGRVWSYRSSKWLVHTFNAKGYHKVGLYIGNYKYHQEYVHVLILLTYVGLPPAIEGYIGSHKDDNNNNNTLDNLSWKTYSQNMQQAIVNGKYAYKLNEDQVRAIRQRRTKGASYLELSAAFDVSVTAIGNIVKRKTWTYTE